MPGRRCRSPAAWRSCPWRGRGRSTPPAARTAPPTRPREGAASWPRRAGAGGTEKNNRYWRKKDKHTTEVEIEGAKEINNAGFCVMWKNNDQVLCFKLFMIFMLYHSFDDMALQFCGKRFECFYKYLPVLQICRCGIFWLILNSDLEVFHPFFNSFIVLVEVIPCLQTLAE